MGRTAAAITVITNDDIRRSGVTTIADALALADGVQVARLNNGTWAVSARGFNATSANKLLVMVDGRIEYSPLFSGTFWNMLDYTLEDIERIEVIRGAGATLWGANLSTACQLVTRHSRTRGDASVVRRGNEDPALADVRYGGAAAGATYAFTASSRGEVPDLRQRRVVGRWPATRAAGFRIDRPGGGGEWLVKGDVFRSEDDVADRATGIRRGGVAGGWSRTFTPGSNVASPPYYRREFRDVPLQLTHAFDTVGWSIPAWVRLANAMGDLGARLPPQQRRNRGRFGVVRAAPLTGFYSVISVFAQDEIAIRPDHSTSLGLRWSGSFSGMNGSRTSRPPRRRAGDDDLGALSRRSGVHTPDVDVQGARTDGSVVAIVEATLPGGGSVGRGIRLPRTPLAIASIDGHAVQSQLRRSAQPGAPDDRSPDRGRNTLNAAARAWSWRDPAAAADVRTGPATRSSTSRSPKTSTAAIS